LARVTVSELYAARRRDESPPVRLAPEKVA
jgi:hypothetical protein